MALGYRIKNWSTIYERSDAKRMREGAPLSWVAIPTKHDGRGYKRLMKRKDGLEVFGAFILMVEVAGKMPVRGTLADSDGPLSALDLADKTDAPEDSFTKSIEVLSDKGLGINWVEVYEDTREYVEVSSGRPSNETDKTRQDRTGRNRTRRTIAADAAAAKPEHQSFIDYFCERWEEKYGLKYDFQGKKEGNQTKAILDRLGRNLDAAKAVVDSFLADEGKLFIEHRHSIGILLSQIRKFTVPEPARPARTGNGEINLCIEPPSQAVLAEADRIAAAARGGVA